MGEAPLERAAVRVTRTGERVEWRRACPAFHGRLFGADDRVRRHGESLAIAGWIAKLRGRTGRSHQSTALIEFLKNDQCIVDGRADHERRVRGRRCLQSAMSRPVAVAAGRAPLRWSY
jgi:hypothetical protein